MNKKFLNIKDLSEYLGVTINTLYAWVNQRKIPYLKMGRLVRFDREKIEEWVESKGVKTYESEQKK
ncbi:MAG: helix-turn-helix domain-containing protein [Candidatus Aadella gelida]|nr:helix-turn-helix domain-containing protein [Candidatus Aadella gelida]